MNRATFYLKRVVGNGENGTIKGEKYVRVDWWKNILGLSELPAEYFNESPRFYYSGIRNGIVVYPNSEDVGKKITIYIESYIEEEQWKKLEKAMKQAGDRLRKAHKEEEWHGKFKIEI